MNREKIEKILSEIEAPYIKQDLISAKTVKDIIISDNQVSIFIQFGYPVAGIKE